MRQLHADRDPWTLVKELIQNAWDEYPSATMCEVRISSENGSDDITVVEVEDDGAGFADIKDAYTLMAPTAKRLDPNKRGRFNLGEKEIMSVALSGKVETVGHTVLFPENGGRETITNRRKSGTVVSARMPWNGTERQQLAESLERFIPDECGLSVNSRKVAHREPVAEFEATLPTVLQDAPNEPIRPTSRRTSVKVYRPQESTGWLYEMGIPVQPIECFWDVNIGQKIPMPPNRDTVGKAYLRAVSAEVLNETFHLIDDEKFADTWIRSAMEDKRISASAVRIAAQKRYGEKTLIWSNDPDANMRATDAGYQLVHPRSMSPEERDNIKTLGGIKTTHDMFGRGLAPSRPAAMTDAKREFAVWVKSLADRCGFGETDVVFFCCDSTSTAARCSGDARHCMVSFNASIFSDEWFSQRGADQIAVIVHELAHASSEGAVSHGPEWGEECCRLAGMLAEQGID